MLRVPTAMRVLVLVAAAFPQVARAAAPLITLSIPEAGVVVGNGGATGPGVPHTPNCLGPLSVVHPLLTATNGTMTAESVSASFAIDPGLSVVPGSCSASTGTCTIVNPSEVTWTATLQPGETGALTFAERIAAGTPINTTLCTTVSVTFDSEPPITLQGCLTTNSADECDLGAPLLDTSGRALLIAVLALVGTRLVARRAVRRNG